MVCIYCALGLLRSKLPFEDSSLIGLLRSQLRSLLRALLHITLPFEGSSLLGLLHSLRSTLPLKLVLGLLRSKLHFEGSLLLDLLHKFLNV